MFLGQGIQQFDTEHDLHNGLPFTPPAHSREREHLLKIRSWGVNSLEAPHSASTSRLSSLLSLILLLPLHPYRLDRLLGVPGATASEPTQERTSLLSLWDLGFSILTIKLYSGGLEHFQAVNILFANKSLQHVKNSTLGNFDPRPPIWVP